MQSKPQWRRHTPARACKSKNALALGALAQETIAPEAVLRLPMAAKVPLALLSKLPVREAMAALLFAAKGPARQFWVNRSVKKAR